VGSVSPCEASGWYRMQYVRARAGVLAYRTSTYRSYAYAHLFMIVPMKMACAHQNQKHEGRTYAVLISEPGLL
jgi:hypothetical protein